MFLSSLSRSGVQFRFVSWAIGHFFLSLSLSQRVIFQPIISRAPRCLLCEFFAFAFMLPDCWDCFSLPMYIVPYLQTSLKTGFVKNLPNLKDWNESNDYALFNITGIGNCREFLWLISVPKFRVLLCCFSTLFFCSFCCPFAWRNNAFV